MSVILIVYIVILDVISVHTDALNIVLITASIRVLRIMLIVDSSIFSTDLFEPYIR